MSDAGVSILFLFFYNLLKVLKCDDNTVEKFPKDLHSARKMIVGDSTSFAEYVVCPKCDAIYNYEDCVELMPDKSFD